MNEKQVTGLRLYDGVLPSLNRLVLLGFAGFWILVAFLEFGQDYLEAFLRDRSFVPAESVAYKVYWPLFILFSIVLDFVLTWLQKRVTGVPFYILSLFLILLLTIIHLFIFSLFLFGFSILIHENVWRLPSLLFEKLSTRLYITLSVYIILFSVYMIIRHNQLREPSPENDTSPSILTVKNGKRSTVIQTQDIKWIGSEGDYLEIHTNGHKHVVLDSLKDMIQKLPGNFSRIHRSTIVNTDRVKEMRSRGNGDYDITLDEGSTLRLSRNYTAGLRGRLL